MPGYFPQSSSWTHVLRYIESLAHSRQTTGVPWTDLLPPLGISFLPCGRAECQGSVETLTYQARRSCDKCMPRPPGSLQGLKPSGFVMSLHVVLGVISQVIVIWSLQN